LPTPSGRASAHEGPGADLRRLGFGGGAGIQADIKAVTSLGGFAMTAVTALTAQNTLGVQGVLGVEPDFIRRQIASVLDDLAATRSRPACCTTARPSRPSATSWRRTRRAGRWWPDPVNERQGGHPLLQPWRRSRR
jgi:hydroxymethylpyrimidine/phosphomethylpyrimidine kinase